MAFNASDPPGMYLPAGIRRLKLLIAGPFAVGKTTFVKSLSEIPVLTTEEVMTQAGAVVDHLPGASGKTTTTVGLDFGRLTLNPTLVLYLFGTPGQDRFAPLWQDIAIGALGAVVLVDTSRLQDSFAVMDRLEQLGLPYAVAINRFDGAPRHSDNAVRAALDLLPDTPLLTCDARDRASSVRVLIALIEHLHANTLHSHREPV